MFIIITSRPEFLIHVELTQHQKKYSYFILVYPKFPWVFDLPFSVYNHSVEKSLLEGLHLRKNRHFLKGDFYSLCVSQKVLISLTFFCFLSTNCFSVVPLQLKYSAAHLYSWHYRWRSCASVFVSLSYLYYCCCIILSRIALYCWQNNSYLGVIHLLYYLKWSSGTKSPYCFFSPRLTTKPCLLYYIYSLSQTNHVAKSYCTSLTVL